MLSLLFSIFLLFETLMIVAQGQSYNNTTEGLIREHQTPESLNYPTSNGFTSGNSLVKPSSLWGCDKYSAAVYVVTKGHKTFAKEVTIYLQSNENDSEELSKISTSVAVRKLKLNILHKGVYLYRDLILIFDILWRDSMNAASMLGKQLSNELEHRISRLPLA